MSQIHQDALSTVFLSWRDKQCHTPVFSSGLSQQGSQASTLLCSALHPPAPAPAPLPRAAQPPPLAGADESDPVPPAQRPCPRRHLPSQAVCPPPCARGDPTAAVHPTEPSQSRHTGSLPGERQGAGECCSLLGALQPLVRTQPIRPYQRKSHLTPQAHTVGTSGPHRPSPHPRNPLLLHHTTC